MKNQNMTDAALGTEQLDALAQSFLPVMREFFNSERGKKIWEEHLRESEQDKDSAA